jgi:hypothetical protein
MHGFHRAAARFTFCEDSFPARAAAEFEHRCFAAILVETFPIDGTEIALSSACVTRA